MHKVVSKETKNKINQSINKKFYVKKIFINVILRVNIIFNLVL